MSVFSISGLSSGINTEDIVKKLMDIEKKPLTNLQTEQKTINSKLPLMRDINYKLIELKSIMKDLTYETPFATKKISSSNSTAVSALINGPAASDGSYIIDSISKIATSSVAATRGTVGGNADVNAKISASIKKSVTGGSFSINNLSFYVDPAADSITDVMNKINLQTATTGVTASYDSTNDKFILENAVSGNKNAIVLGSPSDSSDFLSVIGLSEAFQDTSASSTKVASIGHLGAVDPSKMMSEINFDRAFTAGKIKINGVEISVSDSDSINDIMNRITASNAGVTATFDASTDKIKLSAKNTGASYIKVEEVAGGSNFLELTGLIGVKSGSSISATAGSILSTDSLIGNANLKTALTMPATMRITQGGVSKDIQYQAGDTVQDFIDSINASGLNVTASYDSGSGKFYIKPSANSDPNISLSDVDGNLTQALNLSSSETNQTIGSNAEYKVNGVTYYSNTNTITDKFKDISFTLSSVTASSTTLGVSNDANTAKENIEKFVKSYNEILVEIDKQLKDEEGPLYKDSSLRDILDGIKKSVNKYVENGTNIKSLSDIGITTGALGMVFTDDYIGKLEIDSAKLESALASNSSDVRKLFAYDPASSNNYTDGVAYNFSNYLESLTKVDGTLNKVIEVTNKELQRVTTSILDWNSRMTTIEKGLYEKFNSMEVMIGQIKRQGEALSQQLAQLSA
ncbi:MAG: Flagellar hook-associated protein 2 [bacterium ADurb.Bin243]|nr:MAG: Flagellar hook-associated protein 2 [bacterium ADurb.Bin243]HOD40838.1 flagellar filament capping protein FliD [Candidatus Wallbacteria bacterium]